MRISDWSSDVCSSDLAARLGPDWDIEVLEMHHRHKVDAPSGTGLFLGTAAAAGRGVELDHVSDRAREGITGPRRAGHKGVAGIPGGSGGGVHKVRSVERRVGETCVTQE